MAEVDHVYNTIDAFFECWKDPDKYSQQFGDLKTRIIKCTASAMAKLAAIPEDERTELQIKAVEEAEKAAVALDADPLTPESMKEAVRLAMVARRAQHPLDGKKPWDPPRDPAECLRDDNDPYSFAIFNDLVEGVQSLLPPMFQLATEAWEDELPDVDTSFDAEGSANQVPCETCGAEAGKVCQTGAGKAAKQPHLSRKIAYSQKRAEILDA